MGDSPVNSRAKRQKIDRKGRFSALEKLKQLKGSKHKYEIDEVSNVYDTIDEDEYSERVLQRQEEDWIEDDDGCGYVEDGREIFDEDDEDSAGTSSRKKDKEGSERGLKRKARVAAQPKGNIRSLLGAMPVKKKEDIKTSEDSILLDIMSDLNSSNLVSEKPKLSSSSNNLISGKREAQNYFKNLSSNTKKQPLRNMDIDLERKGKDLEKKKNNESEINKKHSFSERNAMKHEILSDVQEEQIFCQNEIKTLVKEEKIVKPISENITEFSCQDFDEGDFKDTFEDVSIKNENVPCGISNVKQISAVTSPTKHFADVIEDDFLDDAFEIFHSKENNVQDKESISNVIKSLNNWDEQTKNSNMDSVNLATSNFDTQNLPLHVNEKGEKTLRFFWLDAWEDRYLKPGLVFLFGKVYVDPTNKKSQSVSCCLTVRNIDRKLYLLPREYKLDPITLEEENEHPVSMMDVYQEFNTKVAADLNLKEFKSRKVTKNYAFNLPNVPAESEYLEVKYSASYPAPPNTKQYLTFSHIFGANTSSLERFLLEQKIKGPCWLEIREPKPVDAKLSWCKMEVSCDKMENISILRTNEIIPPPPLIAATVNMRTATDERSRRTRIVMLSCLVHNQYEIHKPPPNPQFQTHFCVFTRCNDIWPIDIKQTLLQYKGTKATKCDSERELLSYFLVQFWKLDADLVIGHDLQGNQQDILICNILDANIPNWSRLGRLKRSVAPKKIYASKDAFLGRLVCDIKLSAMELIRSRSYDLETLCANILKLKDGERVEVVPEELTKYYENSQDLLRLISLTMQDTSYILKMMYELNVIPLALQITQIAGNIMSRTLMGGRSERNEFLLLHAFTEKEYIVPDKVYGKKALEEKDSRDNDQTLTNETINPTKKETKKKAAYSGGLVLDPKKGFYDKLILLMDFNSLYPSIIQEYNICFTTIKRNVVCKGDEDIANLILPDSKADIGILPMQIRKLVDSRREVKKLMKTPDLSSEQYIQYNIRQMALKLTANSMYGCLGFTHSRFYAKPLAALITMKGREILMDTKDIVQKLNYDVIYGDTDSLMINTNCLDYDQVFKIGHELKKEINKKYKQIELDIDGVFRYLLLLKKKKYAAVLVSKNKNGGFTMTQEYKGIDIVRRDWCQLAAEAGKFILTQILSEQGADDRIDCIQTHLTKLKDDLSENMMPLSMLTITRQLTKHPNEYSDKNGQPHVLVALRLNSKNGRRFKKGDIVPYIICSDGTQNVHTQRAYHIDEVKNSTTLKVDINYYLTNQLHPVISRICDPIEGMDAARIAAWLGLDPAGYKQVTKREINPTDEFELQNEREKYNLCSEFEFTCVNESCKTVNIIRETIIKMDKSDTITFLDKCQNVECNVKPIEYLPQIQNTLSQQIRKCIEKYYENWLVCEDPACPNRTNRLTHTFMGGYPLCNMCEKGVMFREYSEKDLYLQQKFFQYLFDLSKHNNSKIYIKSQVTSAFLTLKEIADDALSHAAYPVINMTSLFGFFNVNVKTTTDEKIETIDLDVVPEEEQLDAVLETGFI